jgi:phosphoribosylformylglycinamidine synthase II
MIENFNSLSPKQLVELSDKYGWSLNELELVTIQKHFKSKKRIPKIGEIETIAQTWSEHCKHKTFSGPVSFTYKGKTKKIGNLFKETIVKATKELNKKWCLSVFKDNAGVVKLNDKNTWALAFKVETHNHPCAVEPYGGAETGVGGVIRDILGVGLGAKPVVNTDTFCFAPPGHKKNLPSSALPPERIFRGVVSGVRDYGNRMGIPTASGNIWFDKGYMLNPLVFVGTAGVMPTWAIKKEVKPGDLIVSAGGRTGRDGIHGATFSSADLEEEAFTSAVQIGHPLNEKKVLDALLIARDKKLYRGVTDCGAGGFSSAIGELGADCGVRVHLEKALLKDKNILPWEIWVSESQERMIFAVPPAKLSEFKRIFASQECEVCVLGKFTNTNRLEVFYNDESVIDLDMDFLHNQNPLIEKKAVWNDIKVSKKTKKQTLKPAQILKSALSHLNTCSRENVIRQYDHEVQAGIAVKPLGGKIGDGPQDSCVVWPHSATNNMRDFSGFAISHGLNPEIGKSDPYQMALNCADEAIRNLVCVGADVDKTAFLDNFCWANPEYPKILGALVRCAQGCYDLSKAYGAPFISGKDSLYNQSKDSKGNNLAIPGTLLISAIAPVKDVRKAVTMDLKGSDNHLYLIGVTAEELEGTIYSDITGISNGKIPSVNLKTAPKILSSVAKTISKGLVLSAHDISQGGLCACVSEMAFSGNIGAQMFLSEVLTSDKNICDSSILFSESPSRIVVEVSPKMEERFLASLKNIPVSLIGRTMKEKKLKVVSQNGETIINENLDNLFDVWKNSLSNKLNRVKK